MTIGDVLAFIAAVFLLVAAWVATILLFSLAFPAKALRSQAKLVSSPLACLGRGMGVFLLVGLVAGPLMSSPAGPLRLLAGLLWAGLALLAAVGSAGIVRLMSDRIQGADTHMTPFAALTRGTILYVMAGCLPLIGWFAIAPAALLLSIGSAVTVLRTEARCAVTGTVPRLGEAETAQ